MSELSPGEIDELLLAAAKVEIPKLEAEILRLKSLIQILVEAIEPFAEEAAEFSELIPDEAQFGFVWGTIDCHTDFTLGDLRRALSAKTKAEEILATRDKDA
jgi:hypothetical protein